MWCNDHLLITEGHQEILVFTLVFLLCWHSEELLHLPLADNKRRGKKATVIIIKPIYLPETHKINHGKKFNECFLLLKTNESNNNKGPRF